eukprot:XP_019919971.1 PREDICTED: delta-like protein 4 isoform X1 [Crassostrea gigas]
MMYRSVLFHIILYWFLISQAKNEEHCALDGSDDCHIFDWRPWGSCIGICGHQKQSRERVFCCDANVIPHDIKHCLQHCHFPNNFERLQNKTCRVCENGGTFSSISSSCICGPRFTGGCCQDTVKCSDNPCKHGTCSDHPPSFACTCDPGYKGIVCDTRKTCSEGVTCQNGGTCQDGPNGFQCHCSNKFSGEFCEKALSCSDVPCQNGGSCINTGSSFRCRCPPTHAGDVCEKVILCSSHPCLHGTCTDTASGFSCLCDVKHKGVKCDQPITCASTPCQHGSCADSPTGFMCTCDSSYTGIRCDTGFHVKPLETTEPKKLLLPIWFPYLEYALLTLVSLTGVMAMGCACLKCCRAVGVLKGNDDDDDEKRDESGIRRFKQDPVIPVNIQNSRRTGLDF